jgi:predicted nucleotidyltransferase
MVNLYKNIVRIKVLAEALEKLNHNIVFVGGAVVELYCDDPARGESRPTDDVDIVIELLNRGSHAELEEELRKIGFRNDMDSKVICRYKYHDIVVDIMPSDAEILGFTNIWYKEGIKNCTKFDLDNGRSIQIFSICYFLASKLEALKSERHGKDYRFNSDFEDIIYLFDNRMNIKNEIIESEGDIKVYIQTALNALLNRQFIEEEISSNLGYSNIPKRQERILSIWKSIVS